MSIQREIECKHQTLRLLDIVCNNRVDVLDEFVSTCSREFLFTLLLQTLETTGSSFKTPPLVLKFKDVTEFDAQEMIHSFFGITIVSQNDYKEFFVNFLIKYFF